jgi:hypothetical protein
VPAALVVTLWHQKEGMAMPLALDWPYIGCLWKYLMQWYVAAYLHKSIWRVLEAVCTESWYQMPINAVYCDNQGAITTANQPTYMLSSRSKHIDVRFYVIRDAAANGLIRLEYVRTDDMTADILTKALLKETFQRYVGGFGMTRLTRVLKFKGDT